MAEFKEVMRQYKRMCKIYNDCVGCPFENKEDFSCGCGCNINTLSNCEDMDIFETTVMDWAHKHPEPVYISAREFCKNIYSQVSDIDAPLPESIAKKFNLAPINKPI